MKNHNHTPALIVIFVIALALLAAPHALASPPSVPLTVSLALIDDVNAIPVPQDQVGLSAFLSQSYVPGAPEL